nr:inositol monophosphatase family protein [Candidatus Microthrix sp.]
MRALAEARPDDAVLSEEGRDHLGRLSADRVWIVDPLDGTREFPRCPAATGRCTWHWWRTASQPPGPSRSRHWVSRIPRRNRP